MFGRNSSSETVMGSPTVQNPAALDNVATASSASQSVITPTSVPATSSDDGQSMQSVSLTTPSSPFSVSSPSIPDDVVESIDEGAEAPVISHPITSDNPFAQDKMTTTTEPESAEDPLVTTQDAEGAAIASAVDALSQSSDPSVSTSAAATSSNAGPVMPPHLTQVSAPDGASTPPVIQSVSFSASNSTSTAHDASVSTTVTPKNEEYLEQLTTEETLADKVTSIPIDKVKLADMKKQALDHLEPLTEHLGGTPEETFKTTMMMIQANDNHTLLEKALEAAQKIEDDKIRAQALLDIINEINYFSQNADQ